MLNDSLRVSASKFLFLRALFCLDTDPRESPQQELRIPASIAQPNDTVNQNYDLAGFPATICLADGTYGEEAAIDDVFVMGGLWDRTGSTRLSGIRHTLKMSSYTPLQITTLRSSRIRATLTG
jgi:hypothetical protein